MKWHKRLFHKHTVSYSGTVHGRFIERCECGYGRIDFGSWFKF